MKHRWDFFIAHKRDPARDTTSAFEHRLHDALTQAGYDTFLDTKSIPGGVDWEDYSRQALLGTRVFVPILPAKVLGDLGPYLKGEIAFALARYRRNPRQICIVPIFPDGRPDTDDLPVVGLSTLQWLDGKACSLDRIRIDLEHALSRTLKTGGETPSAPAAAPPPEPAPTARIVGALERDDAVLDTIPARLEQAEPGQAVEGGASTAVRSDVGEWRSVRLSEKLGSPQRRRSGHWTVPAPVTSLRLSFNPWSILEFRAAIDSVSVETAVLATTLAGLRTLPNVVGACVWLLYRAEATLCAFLDESPPSRFFDDEERSVAGVNACVWQREAVGLDRPDDAKHHRLAIPLSDRGTVIGAFEVVVAPSTTPSRSELEHYLTALGSQTAAAVRRARAMRANREITRTTSQALIIDQLLDSMLDEITSIGFEYAAISVPDHFRHSIGIVRAKNVPPAWAAAAQHGLDDRDIVPDTYRRRKSTGILEDWDERYDPVLWEQFDHDDLVRVFSPILCEGTCVAVVEYGCTRSQRKAAFTPDNVQRVEDILVRRAQPEFALSQPYILLEKIAQHAVDALGADAATIYLYDAAPGGPIALDKPLLTAGAGKADAEYLKRFTPRHDGLGERALKKKEVSTWSERDIRDKDPEIYERGVRGLAAAPLLFDDQPLEDRGRIGILYVDFRGQPHEFTSSESVVMSDFAREVEIAIRNTLLIERAKERYVEALRYSRIFDIVRALPGANLQDVLIRIAKSVLQLLRADNVVIYEYFAVHDRFSSPIIKGYFMDREAMRERVPSEGVARSLVRDGTSNFVERIDQNPDLVEKRPGRDRFWTRELLKSSAQLVLRDGNEVVGIMFVNYRKQAVKFSSSDRADLHILASAAGVAIRSSRQRSFEEERRNKELDALQVVERAIAEADLQSFASVLELILEKGLELVRARAAAGVIMLVDSTGQELRSIAARGFPPEVRQPIRQDVREGVVGRAVQTHEPQLVRNVNDPEWRVVYKPTLPNTESELAVPFVDRGHVLGVINFEANHAGAFSELDKAFLVSLANQVVLVMSCIKHFQEPVAPERVQQLVRESLHPGLNRETSARVVLTGVTAGQGLGFSRAMAFVREDAGIRLLVAIGALTRSEAESVWKGLDRQLAERPEMPGESRASGAERILKSLLDSAASFAGNAQPERMASPLEVFVQERVHMFENETNSALARCLQSPEPIVIAGDEEDALKHALQQAAEHGVASDMVFLPLEHQGNVVGALVVDGEFLPAAQQPTMRAHFRTGMKHAVVELLNPFANLLATVVAKGTAG